MEAARDGDERVVAFGLYIAKSHKQLNTMNRDRQTVLHIAAEKCTAELCRLLITRGCDGAIADVWGESHSIESSFLFLFGIKFCCLATGVN